MPPSVKKSWHRLPEETGRAYEVFSHYLRSATSKRSILNTYRTIYGRKDASKTGGGVKEWASRHNWVSRVADYDAEQSEKRIEKGAQIVQDVCATAVEAAPGAMAILIEMTKTGDKDDRVRLDAVKHLLAIAGVEAMKKPDVAINSNGGGLHVYLPENHRKKTND